MLRRQSNGQLLNYGSRAVGVGGEARILQVREDPGLVAKVYHNPTAAHARKLAAMIANPPVDPMAAKGHVSIAWPVDLVETAGGGRRFVGFLMPRVRGMRPIIDYYNPRTRRRQCPLFNYYYLHRTARNLTAAVRALHVRGYVIGDVNESNVLVNENALVTLVDTDSFQVRDPENGHLFRCPVGTPQFTPPELQGRTFGQVDRTPENDLFGLAVLTFQLLMEGVHPFAGLFTGHGDPPPYEVRISLGHFPNGGKAVGPYRPAPFALPFDVLDPTLRGLFLRSFIEGHGDPTARPGAQEWLSALTMSESALTTCGRNSQHRYGGHLTACPWCERIVRLGGRDPFPSSAAVDRDQHQQPMHVTQRPFPPGGGQLPSRQAPTSAPPAPSTVATPGPAWMPWITTTNQVVTAFPRPAPGRQWASVPPAVFFVGLLLVVGMYIWSVITWPVATPKKQPAASSPLTPNSTRLITNSVGMKLTVINPGQFPMGSPESDHYAERDEKPQHLVRISKAFYIGTHEVTQGQYQAVMGDNPSHFKGSDDLPVENVSWFDAVEFCNKLSEREKPTWYHPGAEAVIVGRNGYRLPTEAEWEYACRANSRTVYPFSDGASMLGEHAWLIENCEKKTHPVGQKLRNAWGLVDMLGNVWEWCADRYDEKYYASSPFADPLCAGAPGASNRVVRGGGWDGYPRDCRPADRGRNTPGNRNYDLGFRVAADLE